MSKFGLIKISVDELTEIIINILYFRLFLCVKPRDQIIKRTKVLHYQLILDVELIERKQLCENVFAHFDDVLRLDKRTIL